MPENFALILGALVNNETDQTLRVSRSLLEAFDPTGVAISLVIEPESQDIIVSLTKEPFN